MTSLLEASDLSKSYTQHGTRTDAVIAASITLCAGEAVALIGPSGSGKSSLLGLLGLMLHPSGGRLTIEQKPAPRDEASRAQLRNEFFGYLHQDFAVVDDLTVAQNVVIPLEYTTTRTPRSLRRLRVNAALEEVQLAGSSKIKVRNLSGGERQRVAVARAMLIRPRVILADEPTAALDRTAAGHILDLMLRTRDSGGAVLIATHDERVANRCNRVVAMQDGRVIKTE